MPDPADISALDQALADQLCAWYGCDRVDFHDTVIDLSQALQQGHSCLHRDDHTLAQKLEGLPLAPQDATPLVFDQNRLYLRRYWQFETELAAALRQRTRPTPLADIPQARQCLDQLFADPVEPSQTNWQKIAAANALLQGFSVIVGGPGTGKTYTVTRLLACLMTCLQSTASVPLVVKMAAPTGKAAQRLAESVALAKTQLQGLVDPAILDLIPDQGQTLHRLLGVIPRSLQFRHQQNNPLALDILVVDESSMIDLPLMTRLFRALPPQCRVILLGDANQLPSVAAGSVLADLAPASPPSYSAAHLQRLESLGISLPPSEPPCRDYVTWLQQSRRFDDDSGIGQLAQRLLLGQAQASLDCFKNYPQALAWRATEPLHTALTEWAQTFYRPVQEADCLATAFEQLGRFRILCATRTGARGVEAINRQLVQQLNPSGQTFFAGQPLMITRNQYDLGLFNGDIGLIWPDDQGQLFAWFPTPQGFRPLATARLPEHETVYAMTIHKTQGSEFDQVALVLPDQPQALLSRELLYTGLTRAKHKLTLCGSESIWRNGVEQRIQRHSGLSLRLAGVETNT